MPHPQTMILGGVSPLLDNLSRFRDGSAGQGNQVANHECDPRTVLLQD
jgi:hypothetical protein